MASAIPLRPFTFKKCRCWGCVSIGVERHQSYLPLHLPQKTDQSEQICRRPDLLASSALPWLEWLTV